MQAPPEGVFCLVTERALNPAIPWTPPRLSSRFCTAEPKPRHAVTERSESLTRGASSSEWPICCPQFSASIDRRSLRPVILLRGLAATAGFLRRFQADSRAGSARDAEKPAVVMSNTYTDLQDFYGSDGTRTRDLRRDRPVSVVPGSPRGGGDSRRKQAFRPAPCGDWPGRAGASGDLLRDVCRMSCVAAVRTACWRAWNEPAPPVLPRRFQACVVGPGFVRPLSYAKITA